MSMHAFLTAHQAIGSVVRFTPGVLYDETEFEPGMLAILVEARMMDFDLFHLRFETRCFDDHNDPLLESNYYDKDGTPRLTAREAGFWQGVNDYYQDAPQDWPSRFTAMGFIHRPVHKTLRNGRQVAGWFDSDTAFQAYKSAPLDPEIACEAHRIAASGQTDRKTDT